MNSQYLFDQDVVLIIPVNWFNYKRFPCIGSHE